MKDIGDSNMRLNLELGLNSTISNPAPDKSIRVIFSFIRDATELATYSFIPLWRMISGDILLINSVVIRPLFDFITSFNTGISSWFIDNDVTFVAIKNVKIFYV